MRRLHSHLHAAYVGSGNTTMYHQTLQALSQAAWLSSPSCDLKHDSCSTADA